MTIWNAIATERRRLADDIEQLSAEQWNTPSQCEGWTVGDIAVHTLLPFEVSTPKFGFAMLRNFGNLDKTAHGLTAKLTKRISQADVVAGLRAHAENQWTPPGDGPEVPLAEIVVHSFDIRRALDLPNEVPSETVDLMLRGVKDDARRKNYAERVGANIPA